MFDFTDKVVLITGGSRGLGKAMSEGFSKAGAKIVIASRKIENCQTLAKQIKKSGGDALAIAANMANTDDLDQLVQQTIDHYGRVDILINNAGINIGMGSLTDLSPAIFDKMYQVNQRGPWYLAAQLAPLMAENGGGVIINMLSVAGLKPPAFMGFYAATKAALQALTKVMAQEWADKNIRVNALAPGTFHSDLTDGVIHAMPNIEQGMLDANLIKRIPSSEEILNPIFYLASESYTTGITLTCDGGMLSQ